MVQAEMETWKSLDGYTWIYSYFMYALYSKIIECYLEDSKKNIPVRTEGYTVRRKYRV